MHSTQIGENERAYWILRYYEAAPVNPEEYPKIIATNNPKSGVNWVQAATAEAASYKCIST
jgi:hypothetical protein